MADPLRGRLVDGAQSLGVDLDASQIDSLFAYRDLLHRWNSAYNLTSVRDPQAMVVRHLLDSLAVASHLEGASFADVGTGAGLPGVPLAIVYPERRWTLLDSNGKKTRFLFQVKTQLGLSNIEVVTARVENWQPEQRFSGVLTRAFADLALTCSRCRHLLAPGGRLYAMKSQTVADEIERIDPAFRLLDNIALSIPGLDEARWLTVLTQTGDEDCP